MAPMEMLIIKPRKVLKDSSSGCSIVPQCLPSSELGQQLRSIRRNLAAFGMEYTIDSGLLRTNSRKYNTCCF